MIRFALNPKKFNTYAFFCPVSRLHLTLSNPVGHSDRVTPAILRALKSQTILDIDNVVDMKTGKERVLVEETVAELISEVKEKKPTRKEATPFPEPVPAAKEVEAETETEETVAKKTRKKSTPAPEAEK